VSGPCEGIHSKDNRSTTQDFNSPEERGHGVENVYGSDHPGVFQNIHTAAINKQNSLVRCFASANMLAADDPFFSLHKETFDFNYHTIITHEPRPNY
jgi:hypothetical protein